MKRPMDHQKQKVYRAENAIRTKGNTYRTLPEIEARLKEIFATIWFKKRYPLVQGVQLASGAGATIARGNLLVGGIVWMKLPRWARNDAVILHELAHGLVYTKFRREDVAAHGREFCGVYYELVQRFMGAEVAKILRESFQAQKVRFRPKREMTVEQRAVAVARIRSYQKQPQLGSAAARPSQPISELDRLRQTLHSIGVQHEFSELGLAPPPREAPAAVCYVIAGGANYYFDKDGAFLGQEMPNIGFFSRRDGVILK